MTEFTISVASVVVWAVLWGLCASLFTLLSLTAAALLERYFLIQERWTYPLWIVSLSLCPAAAFVGDSGPAPRRAADGVPACCSGPWRGSRGGEATRPVGLGQG